MEKSIFKAYASQAGGAGDPAGSDHVCVASSDGGSWGCFGRDLATMQAQSETVPYRQIAQGEGYTQWANLIVNGDNAGLAFGQTGRCHNLGNRILAVAGADVRGAGYDAVLILYYGKYGFDMAAFIDRVKAAAAQINAATPNSLSPDEIDAVITKIKQAKQDELQIIEEYFQQAVAPQVLNLTAEQKAGVADVYGNFYDQRSVIEGDPSSYAEKLKPLVLNSLTKLQAILGDEIYIPIFKAMPQDAMQSLLH